MLIRVSILTLSLVLYSGLTEAAAKKPVKKIAQLKMSPDSILRAILSYKQLDHRPEIPMPTIIMASKADLKKFQDEVESQWNMRPKLISNVFIVSVNKIYLNDDKSYYDRVKRCIDDSLAHELTHYIQAKYRGWSLDDDSLESDAIDTQTWFRSTYCK